VLVAAGIGTVLLLSGLGNLVVGFVTSALFALLTVHLYRSIAGPVELDVAVAPKGSLGKKGAMRISAKATLWGSAAVLVVVVIGTYLTVRDLHAEDHAEIIAHRGASAAAPENTMAAFERAIADHADWIELDVQESADGVVVVQHDSDFMKAAGVDLKVWDATLEDLREIDVGSHFGSEFADQRVPTLREALELAKGKIGVLVELKYYGRDEDLEARVIEVIEATGVESDIALMSLKYAGIRKAAALRPAWPHGFLSTVNVGDLTRLDVDFLALSGSTASRSVIRRAHKRGMKVYVWTVNDPIQMSVMMSRGVDGLITDEPALAHRVQELRADLSPFGRLLVWIAGEAGLLRKRVEFSGEQDA
jgi:glycerophosphoryl diester phosphodiesterase